MRVYADTNLFTRLYLRLPESERIVELIDRAVEESWPSLPVTWLHRIEVVNAIELYVFMGRSSGHPHVTQEQAAVACSSFRSDIEQRIFLRVAGVAWEALELQVEEISLRHTAKHGFRVYDILHVAMALQLKAEAFWSFDPKASKLAELEGLEVL